MRRSGALKNWRLLALGSIAAAGLLTMAAGPWKGHGGGPRFDLRFTQLDTYSTGIFDEAASEIVKYDERTRRVFVVNAQAPGIDVLDASDPSSLVKVNFIDVSALGAGVNSVDVHKGVLAAAIEADPKTAPGLAAFYRTDTLELIATTPAGALPDMVTFTPNGRHLLVANEGEPSDDYSVDPVGSVTVIEARGNFKKLRASQVGFERFNGKEDTLRAKGVRIFGPGASAAQDFEPEYIAVSGNSKKAFVTLQENNAIAVLDLKRLKFTDILPLGYKDHSLPGNGLDASDRDDAINIANWPVFGAYLPDSIVAYKAKGKTYLVTANEGDAREYDTFAEEARVKDLVLDPAAFPNADDLQEDEAIGRLTVTTTLGDTDGDGNFDALYALGGRSFTIWDERGRVVFDSGDALEQITAAEFPDDFNSNNTENDSFDGRSDNKGPEPEGVTLGEIRGRTYAFIGLERMSGIAVFDITDPRSPKFIEYLSNRDFSGDPEAFTAGDLGPEGLDFVPASKSPTRKPLLIVGNEISGTTTVYEIGVEK